MSEIKSETPQIGKDVIESLTLGMYEDCRFIYREYIQNSADAIDKAIKNGIISHDEGCIYVQIGTTVQLLTAVESCLHFNDCQCFTRVTETVSF